jgi:hypothetical protein
MKCVVQPVERQRTRHRNHDTTIDDAFAETAFRLRVLVEMHFGRILVQTGRHLVLGFFDRHAVDMVDLFADFIIAPAIGTACQR